MALLLGLTLGRVDRETQLILVAGQLMLFLLPWPMRHVYQRFGVSAVGTREAREDASTQSAGGPR
jgi:hypothetical protein